MTPQQPTTKQFIAEAKAAGMVFVPAGKLNGGRIYRLDAAQAHGYATDPFGRSAALFTVLDIARKLGYQV